MKSPMQLWIMVAEESATWCGTSARRDITYVSSRFEHEGFSFLTITLPTFGKDFEKSLDLGYADRNLFQGFPWQAGLPRLFGGFLDLMFDRASGRLLDEPSVDAVQAVRQLTLMYSKVLKPCSDTREQAAMDGYIQCEQDVRLSDAETTSQQWEDLHRISQLLFRDVFQTVDREVYDGELIPKHGPGSTADKLRGNAKWRQSTWPARLEKYFPLGEYLLPNWRYYDQLDEIDILEPGAEIPVKVITVPKTQKTPRVIAMEPTAMMYCQKALSISLTRAIENHKVLNSLIGFDDQTPNQRMAREGSRDGSLATIDLSEASDRVSNQHVRTLLANFPHLQGAVDACRSRKADVRGHGVIRLAKYASMGSALCFPMEAIVFLTMIFIGIEKELNRPLTRKDVKSYVGSVRVYGDDIIVPVDCASSVIDTLESFGMRVNRGKTFLNGKFRESCGKEYYADQDVSIVKVRRDYPTSRKRVAEIEALVSFRNQLYYAGYWKTCASLDDDLRKMLKHYPVVAPTSRIISRESFLGYTVERTDRSTFSPMVKGWMRSDVSPKDQLGGHFALIKCLLMLDEKYGNKTDLLDQLPNNSFESEIGGLPAANAEHLERAGRPHAATLKLGCASPF